MEFVDKNRTRGSLHLRCEGGQGDESNLLLFLVVRVRDEFDDPGKNLQSTMAYSIGIFFIALVHTGNLGGN